jgi:hypothetical protein
MGPIFAFLTVVLTGFVLGICIIGAIWEGVRVNKSFKELEQQLIADNRSEFSPLPAAVVR